ncbi:MAG: glycerol-3-phosphate acyltransferase [Actinobacteria bacterium]|nr:glycerol-3-phosphate acyltransferase [Actinomycetota bacterium]
MLNGEVLTLLLVVPAYFLGTFPTALLVARAGGHDVLREGSGNPGASNVNRLMGWKAGALVLVGDFAKGAIAAGVGLAVGGRLGAYVLGAAAVVGHMLPVTRRFKGGKGVATAGGMLVVLFPWITIVLGLVWWVIARVLHFASVASLVIAIAFPILVAVFGFSGWEIAFTAALAVLVIARHAANLRRLLIGTELRTDSAVPPDLEGP